jgi:HD-GYP domain
VFIETSEAESFKQYAKKNLGLILTSEKVPVKDKHKVLTIVSEKVLRKAFTNRLPARGKEHNKFFDDIEYIVGKSLAYLTNINTIRHIGSLMSHNYDTYTHCINVLTFTIALASKIIDDKNILIQIGAGSILHDIGKALISNDILNKPGKLTPEEFNEIKKHPLNGVTFCSNATLSQTVYNIILYHHEKLDGSGYPSQLLGERIPNYVRAVTIGDIYDALISNRPYAPGMKPFEALKLMKNEFEDKIDKHLFEILVALLAG